MGAFINNFQSPRELEELQDYLDNWSTKTNVGLLLDDCNQGSTEWSVDKRAHKGDIVFFMCAATSISHMGHVRAVARKEPYLNPALLRFAEQEYDLYKKYAGNIICIGKMLKEPYTTEDDSGKIRWWGEIGELERLDNMVSLSDIKGFINISTFGSVTFLKQEEIAKLVSLIIVKNPNLQNEELRRVIVDNLDDEFEKKYEKDFEDQQKEREKKESTTHQYARDHALVEKLKNLYHHRCQLCDTYYDIPMENGSNYVEVHHIIPNSIGYDDEGHSVDQPGNMIVVCPNHHRHLHFHKGGEYQLVEENDEQYLVNSEDRIKVKTNYHLKSPKK